LGLARRGEEREKEAMSNNEQRYLMNKHHTHRYTDTHTTDGRVHRSKAQTATHPHPHTQTGMPDEKLAAN
jgi:hypothetical protein